MDTLSKKEKREKEKKIGMIIFPCILLLVGFVSATAAYNNLHVNIQTTFSNGSIQTGTFNFVFNISNNSGDCSPANIVYSNSVSLTTDSRGIISYYLPDVNLDYTNQYWLCYYRNGILSDTSELSKVPYAFQAKNVTLSGIKADSNFDLKGYNMITTGTGFFSFLGSLANRISKLFVQDIDASGNINLSGNMTIFSAYGNAFSVINSNNSRKIFSVDTVNGIVTIDNQIRVGNMTVSQFNTSNITANQYGFNATPNKGDCNAQTNGIIVYEIDATGLGTHYACRQDKSALSYTWKALY